MHSTTYDMRHMTHRGWRALSQHVISLSVRVWEWSKNDMGYLARLGPLLNCDFFVVEVEILDEILPNKGHILELFFIKDNQTK